MEGRRLCCYLANGQWYFSGGCKQLTLEETGYYLDARTDKPLTKLVLATAIGIAANHKAKDTRDTV
jgi:hypothetical protein